MLLQYPLETLEFVVLVTSRTTVTTADLKLAKQNTTKCETRKFVGMSRFQTFPTSHVSASQPIWSSERKAPDSKQNDSEIR